jgi:hypothetical protein
MTNLTRLQNHESGLASRFNTLLCTVKQLAAVVIAVLAISSTASAQTFPTNCSSKDLDAIETILQGSTANSLMPGNRKISLTIANKSTSDRRAFVMWAKMNRYDINGVLKESRNIAFGVDSVKKSSTMTLTSRDSLYFGTDDMIELTNIYTAWSAKTTDDITYLLNNSSKIAPNCAVKNPVKVYTGVNARFFTEKAACANGKGIIKSRPFGGKAPYTVSVSLNGSTSQTTTTVTNDLDSVIASMPPGIYKVTVVDAKYNSSVFTREILAPDGISKPSANITHPNCTIGKGQIKVINFANGTKYDLTQNGVVKYSASSADFLDVEPGDYKLVATQGVCVNADTAKVNNRPLVPNKPTYDFGHPSCDKPKGWVKVNNAQTDVTYQLTANGNTVSADASGNFIEVDGGSSYVVVAKGNICNNNSDGVTINPRPNVPGKPSLDVTHPNCQNDKGQIKVKNTENNVTYTLLQGSSSLTSASAGDFSSLEPGDYIVQANGKSCNSNSDVTTVNNRPYKPASPKFTIDHPTCTRIKGIITILEADANATYSLDLNGSSTPAVNGGFADVEPGTYQVVAKGNSLNSCSNGSGATVNPAPPQPHDIEATITQSNTQNCLRGGRIDITTWGSDKANNYFYALVNNTDTIYSVEGVLENVKAGTYDLYVRRGQCFKTSGVVINEAAPRLADISDADVTFTQPSLCADGSITINNAKYNGSSFVGNGGSVEYAIFDGKWQSSNSFAVGANVKGSLNIQVQETGKSAAERAICPGEFTGVVPCSAVAPEVATSSNKTIAAEQTAKTTTTYLGSSNLNAAIDVKTIPNPFSSKVRFVISADEAGNGTLEIFNMQGQKVKTVYNGFINKGTNFFDLSMPASSSNAELVYVLRVGGTKLSGKLIQAGK